MPLAARIRRVLDDRPAHRAPPARFREELEDHLSEDFADTALAAVIGWARYAEIFSYDEAARVFSLEAPG